MLGACPAACSKADDGAEGFGNAVELSGVALVESLPAEPAKENAGLGTAEPG